MKQDFRHWILPNSPETEDGGVGNAGQDTTDQPASGDSDKLLGALKKEREQRSSMEKELKALKRQLEAFAGVDPELARKAQQLQEQQEEWLQRESKIKAEVEAQFQPKLSEYQKREAEAIEQLNRYKLDVALERAFVEQGGFSGEFEPVAYALRNRTKLEPDGSIKVLDSKGAAMFVKGEPATLGDLIDELKKTELWFARHFKGYETGGMGLNGNAKGGMPSDPNFSNLPVWEQVAKMREMGGK